MKTSIIGFILFGTVIAGAIIFYHGQEKPPVPTPITESAPGQTATPAYQPDGIFPAESRPALPTGTGGPAQTQIPAAGSTRSDGSKDPVGPVLDALLSSRNAGQKHALFQQLLQTGRLDQAIAELQQRAADNPNDPEIPTTLGEALLNKLRATFAANGGQNTDEIGIMAMQADQNFNAALKMDPQNWEAQFVKAASLEHWPASAQKDDEVIQRLSSLIDQQETMPSQPEFAQPYAVLGDEYLKIGQPEKAQATWQLGLQKFPNDPVLQKIISGQ